MVEFFLTGVSPEEARQNSIEQMQKTIIGFVPDPFLKPGDYEIAIVSSQLRDWEHRLQ